MTGIGRPWDGMELVELEERLDALFNGYVAAVPDKVEIHPHVYSYMADTAHQRQELVKLYRLFGGRLSRSFPNRCG